VSLRRLLVALLLTLIAAPLARAHEVRPALLQFTEDRAGRYDVLWKQPTLGDVAIRLEPHISGGALEARPTDQFAAPGFLVKTWTIPARPALDGQTVSIEGLDQTITDVLVRVATADGRHIDAVIKPQHPSLVLAISTPQGLAVPAYLRLGVEHILTGFDHLSFVLGLLLLVGISWRIIKAVTAFTVAHSMTLTAAALGFVQAPSAVIECLVALSIVFVASELLPRPGRENTLTRRRPWVIAFAFGLLHGFAFAGALAEVGLPANAVPASLFLFNVGVEIGQLMFIAAAVAAILGLRWVRANVRLDLSVPARLVPAYGIGGFAAYWFIERLGAAFPT
jgi:hydrogenase/urease accessory protein HupE